MDIVIVIPARYGSRRFPGKPMVPIRGRSLLTRTWSIANAVTGVSAVYVATEDGRVAEHARSIGASALMTSPECRNGSERVWEAVSKLPSQPNAVINLQGDAVLTPPWVVQALVDTFRDDPTTSMVTAAVHCSEQQLEELKRLKEKSPTSGTTVVMDRFGRALYFSKGIIPYLRIRDPGPPPVHRHIGIYGYSTTTLEQLMLLEEGPLERAEQLEQLRALENGIPIKVAVVDYRGRTHGSVDAPEDLPVIEAIIEREGELITA
jgi:3-deoxy-manno-octulosonate cytidylyltransferase (CMP-KDO synthetase)